MPKPLNIIGLSGTNGSGKDTVGHILMNHYGWYFVSVTDLLRDEAIKRGQLPDRLAARTISIEWRRKDGLAVLVERAIKLYKDLDKSYKGLVVSSLRNPGEGEKIHELNGKIIWVDADPKIRYKRIQDNLHRRGRTEDEQSYEKFLEDEKIELYSKNPEDKTLLNTIKLKEMADIILINDSNDLSKLTTKIGKLLNI